MARLLLVLLIAGCAADVRTSPERVTREYARLMIDGDLLPVYRLLSTFDRVDVPQDGYPDNLPSHVRLSALGIPRAKLDSVRVIPRGERSAVGVAFMTAPDFDRSIPGGLAQFVADGVGSDAVDRAAANLPRTMRVDSVALVREDGHWRVTFQLEQHARARALWQPVAEARDLQARATAAGRFLAAADSVVGFDPAKRAAAAGYARAWALRDSLEFDLRIEGPSFQAMITGEVRNRSATTIEALQFTALTSAGDRVPLSLRTIPARGTNRVMKLGKAGGRVTGVTITSLVMEE